MEFDQAEGQPSVHYRASQQQHALPASTPQPEGKYYRRACHEPACPPFNLRWMPVARVHVFTPTHAAFTRIMYGFLPSCTGRDGGKYEKTWKFRADVKKNGAEEMEVGVSENPTWIWLSCVFLTCDLFSTTLLIQGVIWLLTFKSSYILVHIL